MTSPAWREAHCEVLAAGVSCVHATTKTTCSGYKAGHMPFSQPPVFLTEVMAVCPGTYWCAPQQGSCNCKGEITYAAELFTGETYTVPEADRKYKVTSNGTWLCGTDQSGHWFQEDPAPFRRKHCWCTPQGILDIVQHHGGALQLHKKQCSEIVNDEFNSASSRRLQSWGTELADDRPQASAPTRELGFRDGKYFSYTPWALVTVQEDSDFGLDASDHPGGQLRCAYEYGVPTASAQLYQSPGAYSGDVWEAEDVAKRWGRAVSRTCWVREAQEPTGPVQTCAIALEEPRLLLKQANGKDNNWRTYLMLGLLVCLAITAVCCLQYWRQRQQDESDSSSSEEDMPLTR